MIRDLLKTLWREYILCEYDPQESTAAWRKRGTAPQRPSEAVRSTQPQTATAGRLLYRQTDESEWEKQDGRSAATAGRRRELTEYDLRAIEQHNRDDRKSNKFVDKAQIIKPYYALDIEKNIAAAELSRDAQGRSVSGYSSSTIRDYYALFSAALLMEKEEKEIAQGK